MRRDLRESELDKWLVSQNMTMKAFCEKVPCSIPTAWKVKRGIVIGRRIAKEIRSMTLGHVQPLTRLPY